MNNIPIIRLEVEGMKHTMLMHLMEYQVQVDAYVKQAIESYCSEENLAHVINKHVKEEMDAAVKAEVRDFFGYGKAGRRAVKEAIEEYLKRTYPEEWFVGEKE